MIYVQKVWGYRVIPNDTDPVTYSIISDPVENVEDGSEFWYCNISQFSAHTPIFPNARRLKFIECNLFNCDLPASSKRIGGIHAHAYYDSSLGFSFNPIQGVSELINESGFISLLSIRKEDPKIMKVMKRYIRRYLNG